MGNIVLLDELTINKIAAGEVIERPASAVKEMVENSIDAGATNIQIEIKNGGISYIRITDNGKGVMLDDMEIAFERHATSKIRHAEDLESVKSMGFRGEALASISAVANVEMVTRTANSEVGNKIVVEAGKTIEREEVGCPVGTTITVRNLFFNTPVRYKFLKKDFTELGYIEDSITRLALINPKISFKLISSGKVIIQTSGNGNIKDVIYNIFGKDISENVLKVNYEYEDMIISGVIGKPEIARSNRGNQLFFVNKRYVKDKTLTSATEKAYKGMLTIGKYAFVILNIEMNPKKVDVNVHPAKLEVRFEEESKVFKAIYHAINETLLKNDLIKNSEHIDNKDIIRIPVSKEEKDEDITKSVSLFRSEMPQYATATVPTRNILEEIIKEKEESNKNKQDITNKENPINTNTTLESLLDLQRKMKEDLEKRKAELESVNILDNNISFKDIDSKIVNEDKEEYKIDIPQEKVEEIKEENENEIEQDKSNIEIKNNEKEDIKILVEPDVERKEEEKIDDQKAIDSLSNIEKQKQQIDEMLEKLKIAEEEGNISKDFNEMYLRTFGTLPPKEESKQEEIEINGSELFSGENESIFTGEDDQKYKINYKFIGIAFSTYIILEMDKELYIMDQHAAHERIMYEKVKKNFYSEDNKDSQLMILPDILNLTHKEMDIAKDNLELFEKAGFMVEEFGENTIKISGTPSICLDLDTKSLFLETLDEINTVARTAKQEIENKFIATIACKAAVKANMALSKEEVDSLMEELLKLPNPFTCPHGRPTVIKMSKYDIERKFARK